MIIIIIIIITSLVINNLLFWNRQYLPSKSMNREIWHRHRKLVQPVAYEPPEGRRNNYATYVCSDPLPYALHAIREV